MLEGPWGEAAGGFLDTSCGPFWFFKSIREADTVADRVRDTARKPPKWGGEPLSVGEMTAEVHEEMVAMDILGVAFGPAPKPGAPSHMTADDIANALEAMTPADWRRAGARGVVFGRRDDDPKGVLTAAREYAHQRNVPFRAPHYSVSKAGLEKELEIATKSPIPGGERVPGILWLGEASQFPRVSLSPFGPGNASVLFWLRSKILSEDIPVRVVAMDEWVPEYWKSPANEASKQLGLRVLYSMAQVNDLRAGEWPEPPSGMGPGFQPKKKPKAPPKPKRAPPREIAIRPEQPPTVTESPLGVCKRCAVCVRYDVRQGCCTACGRPLSPLPNPRTLKRRLLR